MSKRIAETDVGRAVTTWLAEQDWIVYQEVSYGRRADIVAKRGPVLWIVECKTSCGLAVLGQARYWIRCAHMVSIAVPQLPRGSAREAATDYMGMTGIGCLIANGSVYEKRHPAFTRRVGGRLADFLRDEHRTYAEAGNARNDYYSPYQATCRDVLESVRLSPGQTMKELIDGIRHHYASPASARGALTQWIERGAVPGVESRREGKFLRVYPVAATA